MRNIACTHSCVVLTASFTLLQSGQRVVISAHGNSLRALVKYLKNIPDAEIPELNIPTGQ